MDTEDGAPGAAVIEFRVGEELVEALLPGAEQGLAPVGLHGAAILVGKKIFGADHAGVDGGEHDAVGDDGAERLHEVEGEGGSSMAGLVVEAPPWVEAFAEQGGHTFLGEHGVGEGEQGIDGILGRAAVAVQKLEIGQGPGF